ncbi:MAG TPA: hydantoinase/oxoprolinase family protein [Blastocatellia bacterium]
MAEESSKVRIGIDTGGTFTDFIVAGGDRSFVFKLPSTPHNPAEAILKGVAMALGDLTGARGASGRSMASATRRSRVLSEVVHGTTVATNALLERKGARTALVTTEGFEDVIEIGRQARPRLYDLMVTRPAPLVPADMRFGVKERILPDGSVLTPLDPNQLTALADQIAARQVESIAVCLLFSFANPAHEQQVAGALAALDVPISLSHKIFPEYREYERTSTTVINAYLVPLMSRYLRALIDGLQEDLGRTHGKGSGAHTFLRVMQSNGGSVSAEAAATEPVRAILSGPAGGVVGALRVSAAAGIHDIITFDMGGTSTDVSLCRGDARTSSEATVAEVPVAVPIVDIHTVGAGGGSIARVDIAGALRVGPESAGADPGPVCYGRGDQVTVTDANLVLGRFGGSSLLNGEMPLDLERARRFMSKLAEDMSRHGSARVTPERAALGVISVANANMERALRTVSIERGQDPRLFTLVSFGGAAGLHAAELASALRIPRILVPRSPGTLSALGVLLCDVVKDYSRTIMMKSAGLDVAAINREFKTLEVAAKQDLAAEGFRGTRARLLRSVAVRYIGQSFEIDIAWEGDYQPRFHDAHRQRYGYADAARPTEIVSIKVRAMGITDKPPIERMPKLGRARPKPAYVASAVVNGRKLPTPVYQRDDLQPGATLGGPAIVTEYSSTTLIPGDRKAEVDLWGNILIS